VGVLSAEKPTLDDGRSSSDGAFAVPGVVVVFSGESPSFQFGALRDGVRRLGRGESLGLLHDARLSREHGEIIFDGQNWKVEDLGSRNGTFVDGERVGKIPFVGRPKVVRMGQTLILPVEDGTDSLTLPLTHDNHIVAGPKLRKALREIQRAAESGHNVLLTGETGSGKELGANAFHAACAKRRGLLISVNCATIPHGLAERLLFGAKRGAFSGATADSEGYVQSAEGGVLFLDEVGEIELEVQTKLLRVLETKEVTPLGATQARQVDVRFCFATHRDLREAVADAKFRPDLFYRIAQTEVKIPPLRDRLEEIPWHAAAELSRAAPEVRLSAEVLEACMLRPWPGNIRELLSEIRRAAYAISATSAHTLRREHLLASAGTPAESTSKEKVGSAHMEAAAGARPSGSVATPARDPRTISPEELRAAMDKHRGVKEHVWRELGLPSRFALHRLLKKHRLRAG